MAQERDYGDEDDAEAAFWRMVDRNHSPQQAELLRVVARYSRAPEPLTSLGYEEHPSFSR